MRFQTLALKAVGPFTDVELDLSSGAFGLHVVYGPNEAGKSSTLRALRHLLFGFPSARTKEGKNLADSFLHPQASLRVGATLVSDAGQTLSVVRRMAASQSLRAADDVAVVDEGELRRLLGSIDAVRFETFFGIDHQRLVDGGRAILAGQGDLGQILFAASGLDSLQKVQADLGKELEDLFSAAAQARKPQINALISALKAAEKEVKDLSLTTKEWDEHQESLKAALARKTDCERRLDERQRARARLERQRGALKLLPEWEKWRAEFAAVRDAIPLPDGFSERRQALQSKLAKAEGRLRGGEESLGPMRRQIGELVVPEALLSREADIKELAGRRGVYQQALSDRPDLERKLREEEGRASAGLRVVEREMTVEQAGSLRITDRQRADIRKLSAAWQSLESRQRTAEEDVARLEQQRLDARDRLAALPTAVDASRLNSALQTIRRQGDLEQQLDEARQERDRTFRLLETERTRLSFWMGDVESLLRLAAPPIEAVERFDQELTECVRRVEQAAARRDEAALERDELRRSLDEMRDRDAIPTEEALLAARAARADAWAALRRQLQDGPPTSRAKNDANAAANVTPNAERIAEFERRIDAADALADRLRRESEKVARYAERMRQLDRLTAETAALATEADEAAARLNETQSRWRALWASTGIAPQSPREMLSFLRRHAEIVERGTSLIECETRATALERRRDEAVSLLRDRMRETAGAIDVESTSLGEWLELAENFVTQANESTQDRADAQREVARLDRELNGPDGAVRRREVVRSDIEAWRAAWSNAIAALPVAPQATPESAAADLETLSTVRQALQLADVTRHRIEQIEQSCRKFESDVRDLSRQLAPDLESRPADQAAADLQARLGVALKTQAERKLLEKKLVDEERAAAEAKTQIAECEVELGRLIHEAGCGTAAELPAAEQRSAARRRAEEKVDEIEGRLRDLAGGQSLDEFVAEARGVDRDALSVDVARLDAEIAECHRELRDELGEKIGAEKKALAEIDSNGRAALAAENAHDLTRKLANESERFARLRLAQTVLKAGVERYRERRQDPILRRASEIFARLTCGSFGGLRQDFDDQGRPVLVGVRATNGAAVGVDSMSDGTADQIYLAVRLAWLEEFLRNHEAAPFIVDDILLRFDDERSVETLRILADLSRRTQILFFTHHRHLVDLARRELPSDLLHVQELPQRGTAS